MTGNETEPLSVATEPVRFRDTYTGSFTFCTTGHRMLFTIKPDGTIEFGEAFTTVDEASLEFWEAVKKLGWKGNTDEAPATNEMTPNEKKLLLQLLLEDMRGSFPLSGWKDPRIERAYELANDLGFEKHAARIKELADDDDYRDGRHFRTSFDDGGYEGMDQCHGLEKTYDDKSVEFQKQARTYLEFPEYKFRDWGQQ